MEFEKSKTRLKRKILNTNLHEKLAIRKMRRKKRMQKFI
jgi:hypothetical protein